jgi:predicted hydrocarbon binding protein
MSKDMEKFSESREKFFEVLTELVRHFGFGNIQIVEVKEKESKAAVQVKDNPFAKEYVKLFGFQKEVVDYSLAGIIAGYFSKFFDKDVDCKEEICIAKKFPICRFVVKH